METDEFPVTNLGNLRLIWIAIVYHLNGISVGFAMAYSVSALPFYKTGQMDPEMEGLFVSILSLGVLVGANISGFAMTFLGCKGTLVISSCITLCTNLGFLAFQDMRVVLLLRFLAGCSSGLVVTTLIVLLSDITTPQLRGRLANTISVNVGFTSGLILGYLPSLTAIVVTYMVPQVLFLGLAPLVPESPVWLAKTGSVERVSKALLCLRAPQSCVAEEVEEIMRNVHQENQVNSLSLIQCLSRLRQWSVMKPFVLMAILMPLHALCGIEAISYYCHHLFEHHPLGESAYSMVISIQIFLLAGYMSVYFIMDRVPRRLIGSTTGGIMALCMFATALSVGLGASRPHDPLSTWLPVITLNIFALACGAGFGPIAWILSGELFPPRTRAFGCSFAFVVRFLFVSAELQLYPWALEKLGKQIDSRSLNGVAPIVVVLCRHGTVCACASAFYILCLPETSGLTLSQITHLFGDPEGAANQQETREDKSKIPINVKEVKLPPSVTDGRDESPQLTSSLENPEEAEHYRTLAL